MREIVFDTETTGLNKNEDRIIEIGCLELNNHFPTGKTFHVYINPQGRKVHPDALSVHGISNKDLIDKPTFPEILNDFLSFIGSSKIIAHNAIFDLGFINSEFKRVGKTLIDLNCVIDTLLLARRKHPMGNNSLDGLCKRYGISNKNRKLHGALLDAEILADIYVELIEKKQASFLFEDYQIKNSIKNRTFHMKIRNETLPSRISDKDNQDHEKFLNKIGNNSIWFFYKKNLS